MTLPGYDAWLDNHGNPGIGDDMTTDEILEQLESLRDTWNDYIQAHADDNQLTRHAGYIAGLSVCSMQLAATMKHIQESTL